MSKKNISLSIDMSADFYDILENLSENSHSSKGDVLKKSVLLLKYLKDVTKKGHHIGIIDSNKNVIDQINGI